VGANAAVTESELGQRRAGRFQAGRDRLGGDAASVLGHCQRGGTMNEAGF
jgi:hypothetical protein